MFKFMKSKKGFTLVELMIVVVIMAILVAVAVPIFSAVTANARKKTCIGNQRNIVSQITNQVMSGSAVLKAAVTTTTPGTVVVKTNSTGDGLLTGTGITDNVFDGTNAANVTFSEMFNEKNMPFCPVANGQITVSVLRGDSDGSCKVTVTCNSMKDAAAKDDGTAGDLGHVLGA